MARERPNPRAAPKTNWLHIGIIGILSTSVGKKGRPQSPRLKLSRAPMIAGWEENQEKKSCDFQQNYP
jgi:hypothetical protein